MCICVLTATEHKKDLVAYLKYVCVGLCMYVDFYPLTCLIFTSCCHVCFTFLLLVLSFTVVFSFHLNGYLSVMVQSSPALTPGLRRVSTDTDASNSKSSWLSCPPAEQNKSVQ